MNRAKDDSFGNWFANAPSAILKRKMKPKYDLWEKEVLWLLVAILGFVMFVIMFWKLQEKRLSEYNTWYMCNIYGRENYCKKLRVDR